MKPLYLVAAVAAALLCSCGTPRSIAPFQVPPTAAMHESSKKIEQAVGNAQSHVDKAIQIVKELPCKDAPMVVALNKELFDTKTELRTAQNEVLRLQGELAEHDETLKQQTERANKCAEDYNTAKPKLDEAVAKYHRLKSWFCWEGAALVFLILLRFGNIVLFFIPPPYKYIAYVAAPVVVYGALWLLL